MIAAHFKIVRALRSWSESGRVIGLGGGALEIHLGKRNLFDIRWRKQPTIIDMEDVRLIQLVRGAEAGTDLSFIVEALNLVIPHAQVEGPIVGRAPLILDPDLLTRLHVGIGRSLGQHRSDWKACHWI